MSWIKLHRCLLDWEWADEPNMVALWVRLLLIANHEPKQWHGRTIERGQMFTSTERLARGTGLSEKQIRLCIERLKQSEQITTERANKGQYITICNYEYYQDSESTEVQAKDEQKASEGTKVGQSQGERRATKQEYKEVKEYQEDKNNISIAVGDEPKKRRMTWCETVFDETYKMLTGECFVWSRAENVCCASAVGKLVKKMEDQGYPTDAESKKQAFAGFLQMLWQNGGDFVHSNFSPHVIDSKFNEFYNIAKGLTNGTKSTNNSGVDDAYKRKLAAELAG